jgi:hypothetical protein
MIKKFMRMKKDLVTREQIDNCLSYISGSSNSLAKKQLLNLLREIQISLDNEPEVEDSIDGTRIRIIYTTTIKRKRGETDEGAIRFQYIREIPVDYSNVPIRIRDNYTATTASAVDDRDRVSNNVNADDTIIESYDEIENSIPTLHAILGLLKRIYFMPEDFSNKLVIDRIHKLRNMFSKDEILTFPTIDPNDKAGLIPV